MSKIAITEQMVGRFLSSPLPADFAPDCGITFTRSPHAGMTPHGHEPAALRPGQGDARALHQWLRTQYQCAAAPPAARAG